MLGAPNNFFGRHFSPWKNGGGSKVEVKKSCYQYYDLLFIIYIYVYVYEARCDKICGFLNVKEKKVGQLDLCENSLVIDMCRKVWKLNTVAFQRTETFCLYRKLSAYSPCSRCFVQIF